MYLQYRNAHGARHRIAAERIEMERRIQRTRDRGRRYDGSHRETVADTFGQRDDVWRDAVRLKIPKVLSGPAETRLHFVGYAQAAVASDQLVHSFQITFRELDDPSDALRCK